MKKFFTLIRFISNGNSLVRSLLYKEISEITLRGDVLDVGGGRRQDYIKLFKNGEKLDVITIDKLVKSYDDILGVDFEKDKLPFQDDCFNQILILNVLEHIYNYQFIVAEMRRVLLSQGRVIGFVPFLVGYHPDPHDYFRYTKESLSKILLNSGFKEVNVRTIGRGPFAVNYNNIVLSLPMLVRLSIFPFYYLIDSVYIFFRPKITERFPLGFLFIAIK